MSTDKSSLGAVVDQLKALCTHVQALENTLKRTLPKRPLEPMVMTELLRRRLKTHQNRMSRNDYGSRLLELRDIERGYYMKIRNDPSSFWSELDKIVFEQIDIEEIFEEYVQCRPRCDTTRK